MVVTKDSLPLELQSTLQELQEKGALIPLWEGEEITEDWIYTCQETVEELEKIPVSTKPPTERECFKHQLAFYKGYGTSESLEHLFITTIPYASSLILKFKKHRNFISRERLKNMAYEVALRVVEQYLRRPGFVIGASFAGYIKWKILEVTGEADDLERAKQTDPITGKQRVMPLLSLNSIIEATRGKEVSLEELQEKLNFTHIGGAPVQWYNRFDTLHADQTITGVINIIKTLQCFMQNDPLLSSYRKYAAQLFVFISMHVLFTSGIDAFHKITAHAPTTKLRLLLDETVEEIFSFLKESAAVEYL